ncbi:hypothetical protein L596_023360 [Steinernema carpocapsae]|uniref:Uncharacterized protein n=1 Tax=Steinernema carpocapsae TaxID=34508 RepID=A0A4U5MDD7_STECR|nr:hypothetical protein L596_023360 [Steinernema carpocapsae]
MDLCNICVQMRVCESIDTSQPIAESPFSIDWLLKILKEKNDVFEKLSESHVMQINEIFKVSAAHIGGFISTFHKISIHFENVAEPHQVILKVAGADADNGAIRPVNPSSVCLTHFIMVYRSNFRNSASRKKWSLKTPTGNVTSTKGRSSPKHSTAENLLFCQERPRKHGKGSDADGESGRPSCGVPSGRASQ